MLFFVSSLQKGFQLLQWNLSQVVEEGWRERLWTASVSLLRPLFCVPIAVQARLNRSLGQESQERDLHYSIHMGLLCWSEKKHICRVCVWFSTTFMILGTFLVHAFIIRIAVNYWCALSLVKVQSLKLRSMHILIASLHYFQFSAYIIIIF